MKEKQKVTKKMKKRKSIVRNSLQTGEESTKFQEIPFPNKLISPDKSSKTYDISPYRSFS